MINVLINAYAVSPNWGSEPGVGWNWIVNIAHQCNVFVITEAEWENEIRVAVEKLPHRDNIHFFFNPVPQKVRDMCWAQGDWRFYKFYREWQKRSLKIAQKIISETRIDVIHQLNMIGFREPGYLWKIKGIPFVWGPIGNMSPLPLSFLEGCSLKDKMKIQLKNYISFIQARTGRVSKAINRSDQLIAVLDNTAEIIRKNYRKDNIIVMPETGLNVTPEVIHKINPLEPLKLLWVGRFIPTKKLDMALKIISLLNKPDLYELHIVGWGTTEEEQRYRNLAESLGVSGQCKWYGKLPNHRVQELMKYSDIFLFTSVVEGTPHVVLEAISNNLPVLCFDLCGQGVIVNDNIGWKIPMNNISDSCQNMARILNRLESDRNEIVTKSKNCECRKPELSWEHKIQQVIKIYESLVVSK